MKIPNIARYRECIATQAQVEQIESLLDMFDDTDDEILPEEEWMQYILTAGKLMEDLAGILGERAKSYIEIE